MIIPRLPCVALLCLCVASRLLADGFATHTSPTLTPAKVSNMEVRYYTELLGTSSTKAVNAHWDPLENTQVDTVVCCPMGWRFYNFPSAVDLTWKEPAKFPRNVALYAPWKKMVDNLNAGGDPLRDALARTRKMNKRFVVSFRMNDHHYTATEDFPTHNNFWRAHPDYRLGGDSPKNNQLFNYMVPQVRDFYFAVLEEICTKYDVDGVELDFQRAPHFFREADLAAGRGVMTAHVKRIREMLDQLGRSRGKQLELSVRAPHTAQAAYSVGADLLAWDAAGIIDGITVSSYYIHSPDVGIETFAARRTKAKIFGELNYVQVQLAGTGHDSNDRRFVTPEAYRAATLSFLERGADGVSFFNTYCVPDEPLKKLTADLLRNYKDLEVLRNSDKNYTSYAVPFTMFGRIFPAKNERTFQMFLADELPGRCRSAVLRFEAKAPCADLHIVATVNGRDLTPATPATPELFPPVVANRSLPHPENLKFFTVPVAALKFGVNTLTVKNMEANKQACEFVSAELGLYMSPPPAEQR